jgi:hypothetical protein
MSRRAVPKPGDATVLAILCHEILPWSSEGPKALPARRLNRILNESGFDARVSDGLTPSEISTEIASVLTKVVWPFLRRMQLVLVDVGRGKRAKALPRAAGLQRLIDELVAPLGIQLLAVRAGAGSKAILRFLPWFLGRPRTDESDDREGLVLALRRQVSVALGVDLATAATGPRWHRLKVCEHSDCVVRVFDGRPEAVVCSRCRGRQRWQRRRSGSNQSAAPM